ncbi:MAG: SurA N-terminal domain-containing protein, partial [Terriglobales bacterium]
MVVPAAAALLLAALSGCSKKQSSADVVARVNGKAIPRSEVDKYYNNQTAGSPQKPTGEAASSLRLSILKELIDNEIMMQRAEKLGLLATDA